MFDAVVTFTASSCSSDMSDRSSPSSSANAFGAFAKSKHSTTQALVRMIPTARISEDDGHPDRADQGGPVGREHELHVGLHGPPPGRGDLVRALEHRLIVAHAADL